MWAQRKVNSVHKFLRMNPGRQEQPAHPVLWDRDFVRDVPVGIASVYISPSFPPYLGYGLRIGFALDRMAKMGDESGNFIWSAQAVSMN